MHEAPEGINSLVEDSRLLSKVILVECLGHRGTRLLQDRIALPTREHVIMLLRARPTDHHTICAPGAWRFEILGELIFTSGHFLGIPR